jgi:SAM-dependent methyltransferase
MLGSLPPSRESTSRLREIVGTWSLSQNRHCLDLRPSKSYEKQHLVPSTSIPLETLEQRFSQLPPRTSNLPFLLVTEPGSRFNGQPPGDLLRARGWSVQDVLELPTVDDEIMEAFWEYVQTMGVLGIGKEGTELLFTPSPVLAAWVEWIEDTLPRREGTMLDIGCGSGRDMGFLASRDIPWFVSGLDNWDQAVKRAEIMVKSINSDSLREVIHAEIQDSGIIVPLSSLAESGLTSIEPCWLVVIVRFFPPRRFLERAHKFVQNGGYLIFSHFTTPPPPRKDYSSPPAEKRVRPGEVEDLLISGCLDWVILQSSYSECEDGRTVWDVVARLMR